MFEYPWEYEANRFRYLHISFIPDIDQITKEVKGFYSFIKDGEMQVHANNNDSIRCFDSGNLLPKIDYTSIPYRGELFIQIVKIIENVFAEHPAQYKLDVMLSVIANIYSSFVKSNNISNNYIRDLIRLVTQSNHLGRPN